MVDFTPLQNALLADLAGELPAAIRLQRLVASLREIFACSAVVLLRLDGESLRPQAAVGLAHETLGRSFVIARHPRLAQIMAQREPLQFAAHSELPDPYDGLLQDSPDEPLPVHDCMGMSLYLDGRLWGAVTLDALRPGSFDRGATQRLQRYALLIEAALRVCRLEGEVRSLRLARREEGEGGDETGGMILGESPVLRQLLDELGVVADSELPVLLQGETGVGKELFARWLHGRSPRARKPLVYVNCAALPETLAESELFGHVKGAFSGAAQDRPGRFEAANGGTLFLDEIGDLPLNMQVKLLRVLQEREVVRLGSRTPVPIDVRLVAATNVNLADAVVAGHFREDLFYRLHVATIRLPPLRERPGDILPLAEFFLKERCQRLGYQSATLSQEAERKLLGHNWPGNIRELENAIHHALLVCRNQLVQPGDLQLVDVRSSLGRAELPGPVAATADITLETALEALYERNQPELYEHIEQTLFRTAYRFCHGNQLQTSRLLGISRNIVRARLEKIGLLESLPRSVNS